jgi:hypothetical protein
MRPCAMFARSTANVQSEMRRCEVMSLSPIGPLATPLHTVAVASHTHIRHSPFAILHSAFWFWFWFWSKHNRQLPNPLATTTATGCWFWILSERAACWWWWGEHRAMCIVRSCALALCIVHCALWIVDLKLRFMLGMQNEGMLGVIVISTRFRLGLLILHYV